MTLEAPTIVVPYPPVLRGRDNERGPRPDFRPGLIVCRAAWRHWLSGSVTQAAVELGGTVYVAWTWTMDVDHGWQPDHLAREVVAALGGWMNGCNGNPCRQTRVAISETEAALFRAAAAKPRIATWQRLAAVKREPFSTGGDPELLALLAAQD